MDGDVARDNGFGVARPTVPFLGAACLGETDLVCLALDFVARLGLDTDFRFDTRLSLG